MLTITCVVLLIGLTTAGDETEVIDIGAFMSEKGEPEKLAAHLAKWRQGPLYLYFSAVYNLSRLPVANGSKDGEAARALWGLEQTLGIKLKVSEWRSLSREEQEAVLQQARFAADVFLQGASRHAALGEDPKLVQRLKDKYHGSIKLGVTGAKARQHSNQMNSILNEWLPIGKHVEVLETIIGQKGERDGSKVLFNFDQGLSGTQFVFEVKDGVILAVSIAGLY